MSDKLLRPAEVAGLLDVHYNTVLRLANEHQLTAYKVGGQWRFRQEDVDAYIARCRVACVPVTVIPSEPAPRRGRPVKYGCGYVPGMKVV